MIGLSDKNSPNLKVLKKTYEIEGQNINFETWKLWLLANWAVTISDDFGNVILLTVGFKEEWVNEEADFFPLVVDWQEKFYATWKIGGNRFQRREWRPTDDATLTARIIDRPIRPMFPSGIVNDTQVIGTVLSSNSEKNLGFWGIVWASLWLLMAWTPFEGPVSACRIALMDDWKIIFNPNLEEEEKSKLNLLTAWTLDAITMVEAWANEVSDEDMILALEKAHEIIKKLCEAQIDYIEEYRKNFWIAEVKVTYNLINDELFAFIKNYLSDDKMEVLYDKWKKEFQDELEKLNIIVREYLEKNYFKDESDDKKAQILNDVWTLVYKRVKEVMRKNILDKERRLDWRKLDEVRQVTWETWFLPRTHGSALFQRGMTQALSVTTLWWPEDALTIDWMMPEWEKRYIHHYNFPPYSVWEVRMLRGTWRREIGHWALAERALLPVLPNEEDFPYTIRVVSEITTCNGSSSMASICGSTMTLMNAWVPIKAPVAWVAMWMIYNEETWKYKILSDIQAQEDFLWDMDFKVARTSKWITAMQLDVKIKWLKMDVFRETFKQSEWAISYILWEMLKVQPKVADSLSPYAPLIMSMEIPVDKISAIIWKWWENIQRMEKEYNVKISIADDWLTSITAQDQVGGEKAIEEIKEILWDPTVWFKWKWKVVKIIDWVWAIVEIKWWKSWMIHISKLTYKRVNKVEDILNLWDEVDYEIIQIDTERWKIWLKRELTWAEQVELEALKAKQESAKKENNNNDQEKKSS